MLARSDRFVPRDAQGINSAAKLIWMKPVLVSVDRGCLTLRGAGAGAARRGAPQRRAPQRLLLRRPYRTLHARYTSLVELVVVRCSKAGKKTSRLNSRRTVDVSGAALPGGGPRWTPARIWRKKLNPVHTLQADIDDGFDPWKMDRSRNARQTAAGEVG